MTDPRQPDLFEPPRPPAPPAADDAWRGRVQGAEVYAFYSKERARKDAFVEALVAAHPRRIFIYLCPKVAAAHVKSRWRDFLVVSLEDFTRRDVFLRVHSLAGLETVLVMENVSRYTVLSSDKFNSLHRLRMATRFRYLIDIVPFTRHVTKLYLPYSYLDREILQYSNGHAFCFNYLEEDAQGRRRRAHDHDFLSEKIAPHAWIDYRDGFLPPITFVDSTLDEAEQSRYRARKAQLFEEYNNPHKIVTEMADCANMMESRYAALAGLLRQAPGARTVVYTNIVKNNALARRALRRAGITAGVEFRSYMTHNGRPVEADRVALLETPINQNRVAALDVLADLRPGTPVFYLRNDSKADRYVFEDTWREWQAIDGFTRALRRVQDASLPEEDRP